MGLIAALVVLAVCVTLAAMANALGDEFGHPEDQP